jgi:predicted metal-dependent peptidase
MMHDDTILKTKIFTHRNLHELKNEKILGGGGTSHIGIFDWTSKNKPETLICFTDGDSDILECKKYRNTIWMLTDNSTSKDIKFGSKIFFDKYGGN